MKLYLAIIVLILSSNSIASCWKIPPSCYSINFNINKIIFSLSGYVKNSAGLRHLSINNDGNDYLCLESQHEKYIKKSDKDKMQCGYYYYCKKQNYLQPYAMDTDSKEFIEIRWVTKYSKIVDMTAELRHSDNKLKNKISTNKWHKAFITFEHWKTISSDSLECSLKTKEKI